MRTPSKRKGNPSATERLSPGAAAARHGAGAGPSALWPRRGDPSACAGTARTSTRPPDLAIALGVFFGGEVIFRFHSRKPKFNRMTGLFFGNGVATPCSNRSPPSHFLIPPDVFSLAKAPGTEYADAQPPPLGAYLTNCSCKTPRASSTARPTPPALGRPTGPPRPSGFAT